MWRDENIEKKEGNNIMKMAFGSSPLISYFEFKMTQNFSIFSISCVNFRILSLNFIVLVILIFEITKHFLMNYLLDQIAENSI